MLISNLDLIHYIIIVFHLDVVRLFGFSLFAPSSICLCIPACNIIRLLLWLFGSYSAI